MDLKKAYDRVLWDLLHDTLSDVGIPSSLVRDIVACVSSAPMQLIWNGSISEFFLPTKGVRQGDPLSLYLIVLGMERLSHLIEVAIEKKR